MIFDCPKYKAAWDRIQELEKLFNEMSQCTIDICDNGMSAEFVSKRAKDIRALFKSSDRSFSQRMFDDCRDANCSSCSIVTKGRS